ncbi:putative disease resistance protein RGA1 [Cinnamomum micranthum f. kanehirae]|uniref:Putative disease resistance protein RGA1 n=1 Tax=Cinnamomum micranthum f. kanehirae TaxID=337451 RepID=A0A443NMR1_9MAGN|nr:putative disease resistance protein RGA1 [Cinnamomum micranthum f. kanehirae]
MGTVTCYCLFHFISSSERASRAMDSAISMVAGGPLNALFQRLLDALALPFLKRLALPFGVEKEAKKLKPILSRIQALLADAEERQIKEESVRLWLSDLKDVAYDAEDILDELAYGALQSKIEYASFFTRKRKLTDQFRVTHFFSRFCSKLELGSRIVEVRERLDEIESQSSQFCLKVIHHGWSERLKSRKRPPTSSIIDKSIVFGRETDREKVVGLLTSDDSWAENGIRVVTICGMGGLGKTTLAQLVYNDERVRKHFEVKAWVYVSEDFDLMRLTKAIAESLLPVSAPLLTSLDVIQVSIQNALKGKKFLLVVDDVWNENCNDWDALRAPLMVGARGSRILVTTRSQRVSSMMGTVPTHSLQGLSDDDCWSLFERRAFAQGNSEAHPDLVKIGKEIVNKCKGLPLAVKTLGGLLRSVEDVVEWEAILKSEIWELPEERNDILPALRLSYHHLPAHLKRCFAYSCIFSNGYTMDGDRLVLMWMAQGFIQSKGCKQMEEVGRECLNDLVSRSLLNLVRSVFIKSGYTMHDLTHDLARCVSGADFLEIGDGKSHKNVEKVRHLSCYMESFDFEDLYCFKSLRTLHLPGDGFRHHELTDHVLTIPPGLFLSLRHIRILNLSGNHITELPESIGNLLQLRYLDLSGTKLERLPKSTTRLYNLQTLMLDHCYKLVELPSDFGNLVNLRHLSLAECSVSIPPRIGRLTSLQKSAHFKVGKEIGHGINELKDMIQLQGSLCISKLENVVNVQEAKEAELKTKRKIHDLQLEWEYDDVELRKEGIEEEVLNALQPPTELKELQIKGYCGVTFPTWLGDSSLSNLVSVNLSNCRCCLLPSFGQLPSLKELHLEKLYGLKKVGREFYGNGTVKGFPSLQKLAFLYMPDLEEWSGLEGDISHVSGIYISYCSKLRGLPLFPPTLERVTIQLCESLATLPSFSTIRDLTLSGCDEQILSLLQCLTSLSSLSISEFPKLRSLPNGLLQQLSTLEKLMMIDCVQLTSLSEEVGLQHLTLPHHLQSYNCLQCTSLHHEAPPGPRHSLQLSNCSNLNCLTGLQIFTSLVSLTLVDCPKIHSLPVERLATLQSLTISGCPLLKEKCQDGGEYWCKISHIPFIYVDNQCILQVKKGCSGALKYDQ